MCGPDECVISSKVDALKAVLAYLLVMAIFLLSSYEFGAWCLICIIFCIVFCCVGHLYHVALWEYYYHLPCNSLIFFPCWVLMLFMTVIVFVASGSADQFIILDSTPAIHGADVCNWDSWRKHAGGVFFRDGMLGDSDSDFDRVFKVHVKHCIFGKHSADYGLRYKYWTGCNFEVAPIFSCQSAGSPVCTACAWAVRKGSPPFSISKHLDCGSDRRDGGICGFPTAWQQLEIAGSSKGFKEFAENLKAAASNFSLPLRDAEMPLIELVSPEAKRDDLAGVSITWLICALLTIPLPVSIYNIVVNKKTGEIDRLRRRHEQRKTEAGNQSPPIGYVPPVIADAAQEPELAAPGVTDSV